MKAINISLPTSHRLVERGENLEKQIDQFQASEFFFQDGVPLSDVMVFQMSESNPEIREKIQETLIRNEISTMTDLSDDEILNTMNSKYEDRYSMMQRLVNKELELKKLELENEKKQENPAD